MNLSTPWLISLACIAAAGVSAMLIAILLPLFRRVALARPNARSSHTIPTPQGAGLAVIAATITVSSVLASLDQSELRDFQLWGGDIWNPIFWEIHKVQNSAVTQPILLGIILLTLIGGLDDIRPISVLPRLLAQAACVTLMIVAMPTELRLYPGLPLWVERGALLAMAAWFINLVNFMDGLDWMMVVEVVPVTAALTLLGCAGFLPHTQTLVAATLCGAYLGFAPFNRPPAKVFLGDVGSLPTGLLLAWLLLHLAERSHPIAALLLPLYFFADATVTLLQRLARGERFWQAHRSHYYQRATTNGFSVQQVINRVFLLNLLLGLLSILSVVLPPPYQWPLLAVGCSAVLWLLRHFSAPRSIAA